MAVWFLLSSAIFHSFVSISNPFMDFWLVVYIATVFMGENRKSYVE
jgi:hypothetical protein